MNPVHEVLQFDGGAPQARYVEGVCLEHHADRSKSRGQYLPLLELAVEEDPNNDRNVHYLGREYFFYRRWEESIAMLKRHLALPTATWRIERCAPCACWRRIICPGDGGRGGTVDFPGGWRGTPSPGALAGPGGPGLPPKGLARCALGHRPGPGHHPAAPNLHQ